MAAKLTNMKLDKKELKENSEPMVEPDRPMYPYGLTVRLDEDALAKLGMETLPKVDSELLMTAKVKVISVSSNEHTSGSKGKHKHRNVEYQICELGFGDVPAEKDAATELYENKG